MPFEIFTSTDLQIPNLKVSIDGEWVTDGFTQVMMIMHTYSIFEYGFTTLPKKEGGILTAVLKSIPDDILFEESGIDQNTFNINEDMSFKRPDNVLFSASKYLHNWLPLEVVKIVFASPGIIVFLSKFLKPISDFFNHRFPNEQQKVEIQLNREKWLQMRIDTLRKGNFTELDIKKFLILYLANENIMAEKISKGEITNIEFIDEEE